MNIPSMAPWNLGMSGNPMILKTDKLSNDFNTYSNIHFIMNKKFTKYNNFNYINVILGNIH